MSDKFIKTGIIVILLLLSGISVFIIYKLVESNKSIDQSQEAMVLGGTFTPGKFIKIDTEWDTTKPELPYRVFRIKYLTYTLDTLGGNGLPTYVVKDRHYREDKFGVRGRFNWLEDLPVKREEVLEVYGSPVFIGVQ